MAAPHLPKLETSAHYDYHYSSRYGDAAARGRPNPQIGYYFTRNFDSSRPSIRLVFMHGHGINDIRKDIQKYKFIEQVERAGYNAVIVAPQTFRHSRDGGVVNRFDTAEQTKEFFQITSDKLAELHAQRNPDARVSSRFFHDMPTVMVSFSGGYYPTANILRQADAHTTTRSRKGKAVTGDFANPELHSLIKGVVLQDSLYGNVSDYSNFIRGRPDRFLISAHVGGEPQANNSQLKKLCEQQGLTVSDNPRARDRVCIYGAKQHIPAVEHSSMVELMSTHMLQQASTSLAAYRHGAVAARAEAASPAAEDPLAQPRAAKAGTYNPWAPRST